MMVVTGVTFVILAVLRCEAMSVNPAFPPAPPPPPPANADGFFGHDFPISFSLDLAQDAVNALRQISQHYADKLKSVCGGATDDEEGGAVCECARPNDVPNGAPPRILMTDPDTLVKGARDEGEAAMTALECRPTVCHCQNGTREGIVPPPFPTLTWLPDKFFVSGLVDRLWDLYFGPVGVTRWPRPALFQPPPPPFDQFPEELREFDAVPRDFPEDSRSDRALAGAARLEFADLAPVLKVFRRRVDSYTRQLSAACPGDDPTKVECTCASGNVPSDKGSGVLFQLFPTLADLRFDDNSGDISLLARQGGAEEGGAETLDNDVDLASTILECQPESCTCLDGNVVTFNSTSVAACDADMPVSVEFLTRFRDWAREVIVTEC